MFQLEKTFKFEAGHTLEFHDGQCRHPHGHSYILTVQIQSENLTPSGEKKNMVVDFSDITKIVKPMIQDYFDHKWLNETLTTDSPTAEFIAKWIFDHLEPAIPNLFAISVHETATAKVTYFRPTEKNS